MEPTLPPVGTTIRKNNALALTSGILGICFVVLAMIGLVFPFLFLIAVLPGILGLIFGIIGLVQLKKHREQAGKGWAIAGIILGALSIVTMCVFLILGVVGLTLLGPQIGDVFSEINNNLAP